MQLDYTLQTSEQRIQYIKKITDSIPIEKIDKKTLEHMSDYIFLAMTKEEKRSKKINTDNRLVTINKRETSFQGLSEKFDNGEDGIYGMITNDKNILLSPKISITQQDIKDIPQLAELVNEIANVQEQYKKAVGKRRYFLKKQLIQMRQDQYVIKMAYKQPIYCVNAAAGFHSMSFEDNIAVVGGEIHDSSLISLTNPAHVSALLRNYSRLKEDCYGKFYTDGYYLMEDLDYLIDNHIKKQYPLYFKILVYKIDGKKNIQIQQLIEQEFKIKHSEEYISCLWRQKIPKLIAEAEKRRYLIWYYTSKEKGKWKKCNRCGEIKLAHNLFFSKNSSGKDGFYSICKECRNRNRDRSNLIIKFIPYKREEVKDGKENMCEM